VYPVRHITSGKGGVRLYLNEILTHVRAGLQSARWDVKLQVSALFISMATITLFRLARHLKARPSMHVQMCSAVHGHR
jgi:hypothetical protein